MIRPRLLTWLCYIAMMCLAIGLNLLPVFLTSLGVELGGLSKEDLGALGACSFSGVVIGIVGTGPMADRWGAKPFALGGSLVLALSLVASAYAETYMQLCVALFCLGLGGGVLDMILSPVVSALNPERRAGAMNLLHSFYCVGAVVTIFSPRRRCCRCCCGCEQSGWQAPETSAWMLLAMTLLILPIWILYSRTQTTVIAGLLLF